jgi:hypothetical protein
MITALVNHFDADAIDTTVSGVYPP